MRITEAEYNEVLKVRQTVMYPNKDIDFVKLADDAKGIHIGVYLEHDLVSVVSIFLDGRAVQFRKLATLSEQQGKSYASQLVKWLIDYVRDMKLDKLWCNARVEAKGFYTRLGLTETDETFSRDGHDYVIMEMTFKYD